MAVNHFNPTVWSARLFQALEKQSIFIGLCNRDWEADASGAETVKINTITDDITVTTYSKNTDFAAVPQVMTSGEQELDLDQQKYFNVYLDDIDRIQSKPDLMDEYLRKAAIAIAKVVDSYIYTTISAGCSGCKCCDSSNYETSCQYSQRIVGWYDDPKKGRCTSRQT